MKKIILVVCIAILSCGLLPCASPEQRIVETEDTLFFPKDSILGPEDSAVIAYVDPSLLNTNKIQPGKNWSELLTFTVLANPGNKLSEPICNWTRHPKFGQSCVFPLHNGNYSLEVAAVRGLAGNYDNQTGRTVGLPFDVELNNVVIKYKIRLATNEEKQAGLLGLGNVVYTLEETTRKKLILH